MKITVTLTEAEAKALAHVADPQDWVENVVKNRARIAMEDIYQAEVRRMVSDPTIQSIPADIEEVVLAADIMTAAEIAELFPQPSQP